MNIGTATQPDHATQRAQGVFVTGTDTGVGKTRLSVALIHALREGRSRVLGFKPMASGCTVIAQAWRNDDAVALQTAASHQVPYATVNPYALHEPIAPHLAAASMAIAIELAPITRAYAELASAADWVVVEGAGGWCVPLSDTLMQAAIPCTLKLPVILVVGLRLGCINHALLSAAAIRADGCNLVGWIGNAIDPAMAEREANLATLARLLAAPCLGSMPYRVAEDPVQDAQRLRAATIQLRSIARIAC